VLCWDFSDGLKAGDFSLFWLGIRCGKRPGAAMALGPAWTPSRAS